MYLCLIITIDRERSTFLVTVNTFCACVYFAAVVVVWFGDPCKSPGALLLKAAPGYVVFTA